MTFIDYICNILGSRSLVFTAGFAHVRWTLTVRLAHGSVRVVVLDLNDTILTLVGQVEENMDGKEGIPSHIVHVRMFFLRITSRRTMKLLRFFALIGVDAYHISPAEFEFELSLSLS